jgi:methylglutamate dehydrogenase subunit D
VSSFLAQVPPTKPLAAGRYGASPNAPGVTAERLDLALANLMAGRGQTAVLSRAVEAACGVGLAPKPAFVQSEKFGFVGIGPGRWLVAAEGLPEALVEALERMAGAAGSVCDQSDGSTVYELTGADVRKALAKLIDVDIDPIAFSRGSAATTRAALIGVTFWQTDDSPTYRFAVARSYAAAFVRALAAAAAEYGFALV